jgi:tetratricopeptide (TPR) repeat protein
MEDMEHEHLEEGDLDLLLAVEAGEAWLRSLLHELAVCPECYRVGGYILDLYQAGSLKIPFGPVDLALARSRAEAPALWQELAGRALAEQRSLVQGDRRFASWGLCELLCQESRELAANDGTQAVERVELAVLVADILEDGEPAEDRWIYQLRGYAWAHLANARRVLGDLTAADEAYQMADSWWQAGEVVGDALGYGPVILELAASLRTAQRRFPEALEILDRVIGLYTEDDPEHRDRHRAGRALLQKALAVSQMGAPESAIRYLRDARTMIDPEREPRLRFCLDHNLLASLASAGRFREAESFLPVVEQVCREVATDLDQFRVRWVEGRIATGLGERERARTAFAEVRRELTERGMGYDTALVSLELAALDLEEGRTAEVKELAREMVAVFRAQEVQREALAALLLFRRAALKEKATAELARDVADFLNRLRHDPDLRFERRGNF